MILTTILTTTNNKDMNKDLGSKINNYSNWLLTECDNPVDEIEYLVNSLIDSKDTKSDILEVLEIINNK